MRSSNRAAAVVELFVRAVFAELRAQRMPSEGAAAPCPPAGTSPTQAEPAINVWRWNLAGMVS